MLALAAFFAARPGLTAGLIIAGLAALLVCGVYLSGERSGAERVRDEIRDQNTRSGAAGQDAFHDVESCIYAGREWDGRKGLCR